MLCPCIQMPNERFTLALSRLDAAIARLEQAARPPAPGADTAEFTALADRHRRLRAGTKDALSRLDQLIGHADPDAG